MMALSMHDRLKNWNRPPMLKHSNFAVLLIFFLTYSLHAQDIVATPGTYELLEGASMQFDARSNERSGQVKRYRWEIVAGQGASLINADQARVTFRAPSIKENTRLFTLQLSLEYQKGEPSTAQINIRVHRKSKVKAKQRTSPWVTGSIGLGFGYLWGSWWPYPPLIVIPCPPPDTTWPPEEVPPVAVPLPEDPSFAEWAAKNPDVAERYLEGAGMVPDSLPAAEAEPVVEDRMAIERDIKMETVGKPTPSIEPAPSAQPVPAPDLEQTPMDTSMDTGVDLDMDMDMD